MCSWDYHKHFADTNVMKSITEYVFDDSMYNMKEWAKVCGEAFWKGKADGGLIEKFPWKDIVSLPRGMDSGEWTYIGNIQRNNKRVPTTVTACIGGTCLKARSTNSSPSNVEECEAACKEASDSCVFDLKRYATVLVYASQVYAEHVLASMTEGTYLSHVAVEHLESMQTGLEHFTEVTNLNTPFLHAQAASVGVMAKTAVSYTPSANYVPGFTYAFFTKSIKSYMSSFRSMMGNLTDDAQLSIFAAKLKEQNAESANKDSVLATSTSMTKKSLRAAMIGMSSALDGIHACSKHMSKAAQAFRTAVKKWEEDAWERALEDVVKGAVDLLTAPASFAGLSNPIGDLSDVITVIQGVTKMALKFRSALEAMKETSSTDSDDIRPLSEDLIAALAPLGQDASLDGSALVRLAKIANTLDDELPTMGHGYWAKYVDATEKYYEKYTKKKDKGISTAAKSFVEQVHLQAHFGNDFVTQGMRFISALHQLTVDHAQAEANKKTEKAMSAYTTEKGDMSAASLPSRAVVSVQINTLALHLDNMARQLCQGYAYQETRLYHKCGSQDNNALGLLCSRFDGSSGSSYTPFYLMPCVGNGGIDLIESARKFLHGFANIYNNAERGRFSRYVLGEGLEKKKDDFVAEVAAQVGNG
jgi:Sec-independent protein translocase protein TatA